MPMRRYRVSLADIIAELDLEVLTDGGVDLGQRWVTTADLNRPGLQWTGYLEHFSNQRLQVVGRAEAGYLWGLPPEVRLERLDAYCALGFPAVIVAQGLEVPQEAIETARKHRIPVLGTHVVTSRFQSYLNRYLTLELSPRSVFHAGLVDVYGVGIMIMGQSGMGKSETTLELVRRGHRLIADDTVEVSRPSESELIGRSPDLQRYFMEIKGIGIVNVKRLFGIGAVKMDGQVDLVVSLERPHLTAAGTGQATGRVQTKDIMGLDVPLVTIPVEPGRNVAVIIEAAAMNQRSRQMGYGSEAVAASGLTSDDTMLITRIAKASP